MVKNLRQVIATVLFCFVGVCSFSWVTVKVDEMLDAECVDSDDVFPLEMVPVAAVLMLKRLGRRLMLFFSVAAGAETGVVGGMESVDRWATGERSLSSGR
jgi:hypothetical protein